MRRSATVRSTGSSAVPWSAFGSRLLVDWAGRFGDARTSRIHGTFAFADVSGFTRLSEALARTNTGGAEDLNQVIDALWHRLLDVVAAFDGDVIQFGGDALALWFEDDEHPARAAACLLEMQRSLRTLGPIRTPVGPVRMRMSAGAERGMVTFVRVGSSHHDLLALGETVSTSLRCESAASRGQTIAGERLMASLDPRAVREGRLIRPWSRAPQPASVACHRARPVDLGAAVLVAPELRPLIETTGFPGEHRHVSVAFVGLPGLDALADTDGGTRIGTRGSPVVAPVERVVAAIEHAIAEYDVCWTASDVSVDAATFLLFAGVPVASEDDEERLLRVCRSILDRCEGMGVKIGCAAGPAFAGAVGTEGRRALAVLGDTVNTAARLRARAAPGELIAARSMIERSRAEFAVEWREPVALKGKRAPLAHGSVGAVLVSGRDLAGPTAVGHEDVTPMVGRDAELHDLLGRTRSHASTGSGGTVRIVGDAGSGKSRLVQELVTVAPADGHRVLRGSCDPY